MFRSFKNTSGTHALGAISPVWFAMALIVIIIVLIIAILIITVVIIAIIAIIVNVVGIIVIVIIALYCVDGVRACSSSLPRNWGAYVCSLFRHVFHRGKGPRCVQIR